MIEKIVKKIKRKINNLRFTIELCNKYKKDGLVPVELPVDKYHNRGIAYLEDGEYEKAIEMFIEECNCQPWCNIGHHYLGKTLQKIGYKANARDCYERALNLLREWNREFPDDKDELSEKEILADLKSLDEETDAITV